MHERRAPRAALVAAVVLVAALSAVTPRAGAHLAAAVQLVAAAAGARVLWRRPRHGLLPRSLEALAPWGALAVVTGTGVVTAAHALDVTVTGERLAVMAVEIVAVVTLAPLAVTRAGARQRVPGNAWADVAIAVIGLSVAATLCAQVAHAVGLGRLVTASAVLDVVLLGVVAWLRSTRVSRDPSTRYLLTIALAYLGLDAVRLLVPQPGAVVAAVTAATAVLAAAHLVHLGAHLGGPSHGGGPRSTQRSGGSRLLLAVPFVATVPLAGVVVRLVPGTELSPTLLGAVATLLAILALVRAHGLVSLAEAGAERDGLTGLHDRRGFLRALEDGGHLAAGDARLCLVDLDGFKRVNDRLGHAAGDALLVAITRRLRADLPSGSVLGRLGGDELVALVHAPDEACAARAVLAAFSEPFDLGGDLGALVAAASVGVVDATADVGVDEAFQRADVAMYTAKQSGGGRWAAYEEGQREKALGAVSAQVELRALLRGEASADDPGGLVLHYQPVIDLVTGDPTGLECLVRWLHPRRGTVAPDDFLPLVESAGLGADLDRWVLHTALAQLAAWDAASDLRTIHRVGVNIGVSSVRSPSLVEDVAAALRASGCAPERLLLEITEHDELPFDRVAAQRLLRLRERGISVALDDFGTGYSSVGYLRRWPVNVIKLDRSLLPVAGAGSAFAAIDDPLELLDGVVALAAALGHDVVAEGVEHADDDRAVKAVGVRYGQGWMYARPMPAEAMTAWLRRPVADEDAAPPLAGELPTGSVAS